MLLAAGAGGAPILHVPREEMIASGWMAKDGTVKEGLKSPEQGAATATWAATSPMLDGLGGVYCEDCDIAEPTVPNGPAARTSGVGAHAIDPEAAAHLRAYSVRASTDGSLVTRVAMSTRRTPRSTSQLGDADRLAEES